MSDYIKKAGMTLLESDNTKKIGKTFLETVAVAGMTELAKHITNFIKQPLGKVSEDVKIRNEKYVRMSAQNQSPSVKLIDLQNNIIESYIITRHLFTEKSSIGTKDIKFTNKDSKIFKEITKWLKLVDDIKYTKLTRISYELTNIYYRKTEPEFFDGFPDIIREASALETKDQLDKLIVKIKEEQGG